MVDVLQDWVNWFHFLLVDGGLLVILIDCIIFLLPLLDVTRMSISTVYPRTAGLWNSLPIECFPLNYNLNGFKSRIKKCLLTVGSFKKEFMHALIILVFFFL